MEGASSFYNPSWDSSMDHRDPFDSALTSIVSSPVAAAPSNILDADNNSMIRELIGRLGTICNSRDSASFPGPCSVPNSAASSSYSTPLNSPPKLGCLGYPGSHLPLSSDLGFGERAARFSCFAVRQVERGDSGRFTRVSSRQNVAAGARNGNSPKSVETGESPEGSSISDQIPRSSAENSSRKRKFLPRGKAKESLETSPAKEADDYGEKKSKDDNVKPPEPPKDYIHVRARRGQATDSHSLAERVRREKISQRMKVLQDLVPSCSKVTGKAVMLDEIINYVQSLQRQVEFLSMKLTTLNPRMDFNVEAFLSKEMCNSHGSSLFPANLSSSALPYGYNPHQAMQLHGALGSNMENHLPLNALNVAVFPSIDGFCEASTPAVSGLWDDELHGVVQMGLPQNPSPQILQGSLAAAAAAAGQMKIES